MKSIEFLEPNKQKQQDHVAMIIFDPSSQRVTPEDIFLRGIEVKHLFDRVFHIISTQNDIKSKIIYNRLNRVKMMLSLVKTFDNLVLTKFVNKVWRRYGFFSHLGEMFLTLDELVHYLPEFENKRDEIVLSRLTTFEDDDIETTSDSNESNDEKDSKDSNDSKEESK